MADRVDADRGAEVRFLPDGRRVCQYLDDPGVFLFNTGEPASAELARAAGYPVDQLLLERRKREAVDAAKRKAEEEFGRTRDAYTALAEAAAEGPLKVAHAGKQRYRIVRASDGKPVTDQVFSQEEARALVETVGGQVQDPPPREEEEEAPSAPPPSPFD